MHGDQYGNYGPQGFAPGVPFQPGPGMPQAALDMPRMADLGRGQGQGQDGAARWVRFPFYPTSPFQSNSPDVGHQTRYYGVSVSNPTINVESLQIIRFDMPCRLCAVNGSAVSTVDTALWIGLDPRDTFGLQITYTNGDRLHTISCLGSSVCGTAARPGELGGTGWTFDAGSSASIGITPLRSSIRVDIVLVCLELRGQSNLGR